MDTLLHLLIAVAGIVVGILTLSGLLGVAAFSYGVVDAMLRTPGAPLLLRTTSALAVIALAMTLLVTIGAGGTWLLGWVTSSQLLTNAAGPTLASAAGCLLVGAPVVLVLVVKLTTSVPPQA